jgi:hypothetical protein
LSSSMSVPRDLRFSVGRIPQPHDADWGTAFFLEPRGLLITCFHVVEPAIKYKGRVAIDVFRPESTGRAPAPERLWAKWLTSESSPIDNHDVALLELTEVPEWITTLKVSFEALPMDGRQIASYGFPGNRPDYGGPASGRVTGQAWDASSRLPMIEIRSDELTGGFSGAPIIDSQTGLVVGMMTATLETDERGRFQKHSWALPASSLTGVTKLIAPSVHPLIRELWRVANERIPSLIDFSLQDMGEMDPMPIRLRRRTDGTDEMLCAEEALERLLASDVNLMTVSGNSGSGKSTFLRAIVGKILVQRGEQQGVWIIPLYVTARSWFEAAGGTIAERLAATIAAAGLVRYSLQQLATELERLLQCPVYRFAILIDALDEVSDPLHRREAAKDVRELSHSMRQARHVVILTSRPIDEMALVCTPRDEIHRYDILPVDINDATQFFAAALGPASTDLAAQFSRISGVAAIGSPLLVAMAVSVYSQTACLPRSVVEIYNQYIGLLIARVRARNIDIAAVGVDYDELSHLLEWLAYESLDGDLLHSAAVGVTMKHLPESNGPFKPSRLVLADRANFQLSSLVQCHFAIFRDKSHLRWVHLSIRDFFAAQIIVAMNQRDSAIRNWSDPNRRGATLFALIHLSEDQPLTHESLRNIPPYNGSQPNHDSLAFLIDLVAWGADCTPTVLEDIVDSALILGLEDSDQYGSCALLFRQDLHPFSQLLRVQESVPYAQQRLLELMSRPELSTSVRVRLAKHLVTTPPEK